jgi:peptidoglycan/xylan/chitin deacetylase (PgdA/CDA1 family)
MERITGSSAGRNRAPIKSLLGVLLVAVMLAIGGVSRAAEPNQSKLVTSVDGWLAALGNSWHVFDNPTRSDVAHIWGLLVYRPGLSHLRGCVVEGQDANGACHVALTSLQDVESVPLLRETLRSSEHPVSVGSAALGLAAFGDDFSRDLVLKALLEERGTWKATDALVRSFKSMPGPWQNMYLAFGAHTLEDPMASSRVAAASWPPSGPRDTRAVKGALRRFFAWWWSQDEPNEDVGKTVQAVLEQLTVDHEGCVFADQIFTRQLALEPQGRSLHLATALDGLQEKCFGLRATSWLSALGDHIDMKAFDARVRVEEVPQVAADPVVWWKITLQLVGQSAGVSLIESEASLLAHRLAAVESVLQLGTGQWDAEAARKLLVGAPAWVPANHTELAQRAKRDVFPEDFYGYNSFLEQPAWYPSAVHVTIDDGPRLPYLPGILDTLDRYRVKASFFFVGAALARRWLNQPEKTRGIMERVIASGHSMAFHSMNHETTPALHLREWEPEQVADSVDLYRLVLNKVAGQKVPITHGRLPGGMGFKWPWVKQSFYAAGLHEHVHWNAGPPTWIGATQTQRVREQSCGLANRGRPTVVLLHEYKQLATHLNAFLHTVREQCPVKPNAPMPSRTTAHWGTK